MKNSSHKTFFITKIKFLLNSITKILNLSNLKYLKIFYLRICCCNSYILQNSFCYSSLCLDFTLGSLQRLFIVNRIHIQSPGVGLEPRSGSSGFVILKIIEP